MKNKKGITLIALIITIIVMIILAGVIITAAVVDGGVIDKAKEAIRENERADVQEIVIGSYVYKVTASSNTLAYLDLEKTANAIYENLTANGFILKDTSGNEFDSKEEFVAGQEDNKIDINVEGEHGEYTGEIKEEGLDGEIEIKEENNTTTGDNTNTGEEDTPITPNPPAEPPIQGTSIKELLCTGAYTIANGAGTELHFYPNGMFRLVFMPVILGHASHTGTYTINESGRYVEVNMVDYGAFGEDLIFNIVDDELNTISLAIKNESFSGNWNKINESSYAYNPELHEKGFYINALYLKENDWSNAISTSSTAIYVRPYDVSSGVGIKISNFDPETNTTITIKDEGKTITYNGEDYKLITKAQLNGEE